MPDEAALFVMAERMLVEVLGRIRDVDLHIELPAITGVTGSAAATLATVVDLHLRDDASVPGRLAGRDVDNTESATGTDSVGSGRNAAARQERVARVARDAIEAANRVSADGTADDFHPAAVRDLLLQLTVVRSLVAHYVAAYLGSTACPLPEELAKPLWERTAPDAERWRETGLFREPLEIPAQASWRDVFLRTAGHEPHPLGH